MFAKKVAAKSQPARPREPKMTPAQVFAHVMARFPKTMAKLAE